MHLTGQIMVLVFVSEKLLHSTWERIFPLEFLFERVLEYFFEFAIIILNADQSMYFCASIPGPRKGY